MAVGFGVAEGLGVPVGFGEAEGLGVAEAAGLGEGEGAALDSSSPPQAARLSTSTRHRREQRARMSFFMGSTFFRGLFLYDILYGILPVC